jgi:acetyl-CoA carboxylase carboxyltransferase component
MTHREDRDLADLREQVREAKRAVEDEGRPEAVQSQHDHDKLTARERVDYLYDEGTFDEFGQLAAPAPTTPETQNWEREDAPADGVVTGIGEVDGRPVAVIATDFTVKGGSIGHTGGRKMDRLSDLALERGIPLVMLHDGGGHRIQEGLDARPFARGDNGFANKQETMSGWVPTVSAMMGPGFAAATNFAALCDFVPMVEGTSTMGVAGPALVEAALGVDRSKQELGGSDFQAAETGMADLACPDDEACLDAIERYLSYLPRNARHDPPVAEEWDAPSDEQVERMVDVMPANPTKGYDIYAVIEGLIDQDSFFEKKPRYARNLVTGFARLRGRPVGIVANNPRIKAGTIDTAASEKGAHFVSVCDAFGLPVVTLADVPGILPGMDSEREGIARHSAKIPFELNRATVPKLNVVLRRGYGFGYVAMGSGRSTDTDLTVVWPAAEIAAMGIEGAVDIAYGDQIEQANDSEAAREAMIEEFTERTNAIRAAEHIGIDGVVEPRETRDLLCRTLDRAEDTGDGEWPPKKHSINPI